MVVTRGNMLDYKLVTTRYIRRSWGSNAQYNGYRQQHWIIHIKLTKRLDLLFFVPNYVLIYINFGEK